MKTVFEGTVNGVKFNNVFDYNNALTKAINEGEPVCASSNTRTVLEDSLQEELQPVCSCECEDPEWFYGLEEGREIYYLDTLTEENLQEELAVWNNDLQGNRKLVLKCIQTFGKSDLEAYREDLCNAIEKLNVDHNSISLVVDKLNTNITETTLKLHSLKQRLLDLQNECDKLCQLKKDSDSNMRVVSGCNELNTMMINHYSEILGEVERLHCNMVSNELEEEPCCEMCECADCSGNQNNQDLEYALEEHIGELNKANKILGKKFRDLMGTLFPSGL